MKFRGVKHDPGAVTMADEACEANIDEQTIGYQDSASHTQLQIILCLEQEGRYRCRRCMRYTEQGDNFKIGDGKDDCWEFIYELVGVN